ncbi:flagellar biosynthetic protein FliO [Granulicella arctica]|uniref:Flagellar biogenesis protein FliO n=1 Tax=Granulicella arctica TaxID=940613 RepID=A0A7Y9TH92_9BACT|nr:flagellar biosynthetic protein FliO [Granulicella arctica]NYF80349.1 flagellar biogenesis protein FliO [Granulicella arctica]
MELVQSFTRRQEMERVAPVGGFAGWVVGALQGRVRLKWRGSSRVRMQQMQLLETLSLGGKRHVMLISCEGERYLVGCGADDVAAIVKIASGGGDTRPTAKTLAHTWL